MNFPNYFADADSNLDDADYVIFGIPFGETSSFRFGSDKAPNKIREASWNFETFDFRTKNDLENVKIHDYGDIVIYKNDFLKTIENIKNFTKKVINKNKFPVAIGGEHSITPWIIKAFSKDIAVLFLDAHMDYRQSYENNSFNHACALRRVSDHIDIKNIGLLGVRSAEKREYDDANKSGLFYIDSYSIIKRGINDVLKDVKHHFGNKKLYISFDVDVIDPAYAPGTSTPEPFGIKPLDVLDIVDAFSDQIIGFDVVEVCPPYDNGQTALLAAKIIRYMIGKTAFIKN